MMTLLNMFCGEAAPTISISSSIILHGNNHEALGGAQDRQEKQFYSLINGTRKPESSQCCLIFKNLPYCIQKFTNWLVIYIQNLNVTVFST